MADESSRSGGASPDSYIGSLISLTSKCEIRYEGILYNINTEESSIGLRDVRSFGTEGRKKDGPQIPASDKIYEYILFRGSDIKDLQVKSAPPAPPAPIYSDPAIIQSHYSRSVPASVSTPSSTPAVGTGTTTDITNADQLGLPRSTLQGGVPLYQPGGSFGSWGSVQPSQTANGSGIAMPSMYWQGYYAPSSALTHLQQPAVLRPPSGLPGPQMQQPLQYSDVSSSFPAGTSNLLSVTPFPSGMPSLSNYPPLLPSVSTSLSLTSANFPSSSAPAQAGVFAPEASPSLMPNLSPTLPNSLLAPNLSLVPPLTSSADSMASISQNVPSVLSMPSLPNSLLGPNLSLVPPLTSVADSMTSISQNVPSLLSISSAISMPSAISSNPRAIHTPSLSQSMPTTVGSFSLTQVEASVPLVNSEQLLQHDSSLLASSQPSHVGIKVNHSKPPESKTTQHITKPPPLVRSAVATATKEPILPLPKSTYLKPNGTTSRIPTQPCNEGRGRRGRGYSWQVAQFKDDFDFTAMNEKFNKGEVWGHLGKGKAQTRDGEGTSDDEAREEDPTRDVKPVYVKDDFFDTLSCNTHDHGVRNGRPKFSEQMKIDTETFGEFSKYRMGRGGGRGFRGGGRMQGSYHGRGGYGSAYRGHGRGYMTNRAPKGCW